MEAEEGAAREIGEVKLRGTTSSMRLGIGLCFLSELLSHLGCQLSLDGSPRSRLSAVGYRGRPDLTLLVGERAARKWTVRGQLTEMQ